VGIIRGRKEGGKDYHEEGKPKVIAQYRKGEVTSLRHSLRGKKKSAKNFGFRKSDGKKEGKTGADRVAPLNSQPYC